MHHFGAPEGLLATREKGGKRERDLIIVSSRGQVRHNTLTFITITGGSGKDTLKARLTGENLL
jgi:hypothetical protein